MAIRFKAALFGVFSAAMAGLWAAPASAQATRTWVSGVGDDANPCSRTAPCKTFAGAISRTAAGGEINCLDPGGYGAVTITKALTIACTYTEGGLLASGNGIVVNAGPGDVVHLRGLDFHGVNPPTHGVRFIAGGALHIQDSTIRRFNSANSFGVSFQPAGAALLTITNTIISENGSGASGGGILVQPGPSGSARVVLTDVRVHGNSNFGLRVDTTGNTGPGGTAVLAERSSFSGNGTGVSLLASACCTGGNVMLTHSIVANNSGTGLAASGNQAVMRVAHTTVTGNALGISIADFAGVFSYGNNRNIGNPAVGAANNGSFTTTIPHQ